MTLIAPSFSTYEVTNCPLGLMYGDGPRVHLSANSEGSFVRIIAADGTTRLLR